VVVGEVASSTEILVIGAGPGGYAAALRARGHGKQVTLVEADRIGGVCLNVGCIPSKALIHAAEIAGMREEAAAAGDREAFHTADEAFHAAIAAAGRYKGIWDLVQQVKVHVDRTLGERVHVEVDLAPDVWPIYVDPHQLENAIVNLAVNARDAMDGQGVMRITAANVKLAANQVGDVQAGEYVKISVSDTGCGMTPEVLERAFEPFFTTKGVGKGTGLGLSMVYGFAKQSRGHMTIYSEVGHGTTIRLYLPRAEALAGAIDAGEQLLRRSRAGGPPTRNRQPEPARPSCSKCAALQKRRGSR